MFVDGLTIESINKYWHCTVIPVRFLSIEKASLFARGRRPSSAIIHTTISLIAIFRDRAMLKTS